MSLIRFRPSFRRFGSRGQFENSRTGIEPPVNIHFVQSVIFFWLKPGLWSDFFYRVSGFYSGNIFQTEPVSLARFFLLSPLVTASILTAWLLTGKVQGQVQYRKLKQPLQSELILWLRLRASRRHF